MNVGIAIRHPEHARFFREPTAKLRARGHEVTLLVREFRHTTALLEDYGLDYTLLAGAPDGLPGLLAGHAMYELGVVRAGLRADLDVLCAVGGRAVTHLAPLLGASSVVFADWDPGPTDRVVARLADVLATPAFLRGEYGGNQVVYDGLQELAYLHPDYARPTPAPGVGRGPRLTDGGVPRPAPDRGAPAAVVGFSPERARREETVETLAGLDERGTVLVAGEHAPRESGWVTDRVGPRSVRDRLATADLCVTDRGTLATEAAVLGTPTVFVGDLPRRCAYLASHYQLVQPVDEESLASVARSRFEDDDAATLWRRRRRLLLEESTDVAEFVADTVAGAR